MSASSLPPGCLPGDVDGGGHECECSVCGESFIGSEPDEDLCEKCVLLSCDELEEVQMRAHLAAAAITPLIFESDRKSEPQ
jgi:hypothetical protein